MWPQYSRHLLVRVWLGVKPDVDISADTCALANFKYITGLLGGLGAPEGTSFPTNENRLLHNGGLFRSTYAAGHSFSDFDWVTSDETMPRRLHDTRSRAQ